MVAPFVSFTTEQPHSLSRWCVWGMRGHASWAAGCADLLSLPCPQPWSWEHVPRPSAEASGCPCAARRSPGSPSWWRPGMMPNMKCIRQTSSCLCSLSAAKNYPGPSVNREDIKNPWWQAKNQKERSQPLGGRENVQRNDSCTRTWKYELNRGGCVCVLFGGKMMTCKNLSLNCLFSQLSLEIFDLTDGK